MYELLSFIEDGAFGMVYEAKDKNDNKIAIKRVLVPKRYAKYFGLFFLREMDIMGRLKHPNINTWREIVFELEDERVCSSKRYKFDYYIIQDYANGHDLHQQIYDYNLPISYVKRLMYQILSGLYYMHAMGIFHGDLKPDNILIFYDGKIPNAKITDFGYSNFVSRKNDYELGAEPYSAPEVLMESYDITVKIDIWSLACVYFEMVTLKRLFEAKTQRQVLQKIIEMRGLPPEVVLKRLLGKKKFRFMPKKRPIKGIRDIINISEKENKIFNKKTVGGLKNPGSYNDFCALMEKMLEFDSEKRYSAKECLDHQFFFEIPEKDIQGYYGLKKQKEIKKPDYHIYKISENENARKIGYKIIEDVDKLDETFMWRILFQSVDLYERCLLKDISTNYELMALTCIYIMAKYFLGRFTPSIRELYPKINVKFPDLIAMEKLIVVGLKYKLYRTTVYEILSKEYSDGELYELFKVITSRNVDGFDIGELAKGYEKNEKH